jgi:hypothetical protein
LGRFEDLSFSEDAATANAHTGEHDDDDNDDDAPSAFHSSAGYRGIPEQRAPSPYQAARMRGGAAAGPRGNIPHPLMFQNIHYVIVTDGGRSIIPVATNRHGKSKLTHECRSIVAHCKLNRRMPCICRDGCVACSDGVEHNVSRGTHRPFPVPNR